VARSTIDAATAVASVTAAAASYGYGRIATRMGACALPSLPCDEADEYDAGDDPQEGIKLLIERVGNMHAAKYMGTERAPRYPAQGTVKGCYIQIETLPGKD
jgi:hypothetical protein